MNFYQHAGRILDKLARHEGTIKGLVIGDPKVQDKKKMYALVCETLKYKQVLNELIDSTKICEIEKKLKRSLALVLIHDLLFTKRGITVRNEVPLKQCVIRHQARLKAELIKIKIKRGVTSNEDLVSQKVKDAVLIPRYARVNEHKTTVEKAIKAFEKEGYVLIKCPENLCELKQKEFCIDQHLPDMLIFHQRTDFHDHTLYRSGHIILQDKASCFPAHVCHPPQGAHVIDACAAPGNKTSHLSALMKNTGKIWAFDLDSRRLGLLKRLTGKAGCKSELIPPKKRSKKIANGLIDITPIHGSFLDADPNDPQYSQVEYLLLDPSCSGSGIISRLDHLVDDEDENEGSNDKNGSTQEERLKNLSEFQISVIEHALKFPNAKRVVYSTCSVHAEENEHVVKTVLKNNPEFELASRDTVLPTWNRRGMPKEMDGDEALADRVVRTIPAEDLTNGFFVSCFIRKTSEGLKRTIDEIETVQETKPNKKKKKNNNKKKTSLTAE
ncbi:S-adenosyl-L-methionine-dependent methyltransferase [Rhizopus microsporus ATCC 52813]|uniref:S-adenosyl-L-methionine-dependent methyltransferase n=1 Tax=Rhizopus microsporus ATCC 52813 TaxID=1340429 RepID=A0A2G4SHD2_RHIZD|nr:S-adenosyl-L-methionine-dependent methyltransferase [Rhizopus microsporus ATCC 52813]PHZ08187.1 S-adenosyl-L-methionine-dependent methyltransferase [Rhizopus microsporus ATCC 52813]